MSEVRLIAVAADDAGMRLDRWLHRQFPQLGHGRVERLLRTGQIRLDGRRAKAGARLEAGQTVRLPPAVEAPPPEPRAAPMPPHEAEALRRRVLYRDDAVLAVDKPPGLAVQGGAKVERSLDAMLDALRFDAADRPRLVHRLDRDTSGVLLLARTAPAARALTAAFRGRDVRKLYWAVVVGAPPQEGRIAVPLVKQAGAGRRGGELVVPDDADGQPAVTVFRVVERAAKRAAWLALQPLTGRTHQLRAHCAALGTPILGDGKYGAAEAFLPGAADGARLHLHARRLVLPHPLPAGGRRTIDVTAPLPPHMAETWRLLGFDPADRDADALPAG